MIKCGLGQEDAGSGRRQKSPLPDATKNDEELLERGGKWSRPEKNTNGPRNGYHTVTGMVAGGLS